MFYRITPLVIVSQWQIYKLFLILQIFSVDFSIVERSFDLGIIATRADERLDHDGLVLVPAAEGHALDFMSVDTDCIEVVLTFCWHCSFFRFRYSFWRSSSFSRFAQ